MESKKVDQISQKLSDLASYKDLFDRLTDPSLLLNIDTLEVLDFNLSADNTLPVHDLKWATILANPEDLHRLQKEVRAVRRKYYPRTFELALNLSKITYFKVSACTLSLSNGQEVIQMILQDISEIKQKDEQLNTYIEKLKTISITDELTQLYNVRYFNEQLKKEHDRSSRYGSTYSLILFDVDNFKHYNDRNGHPAGDKLLKELAQIFKDCIRTSDIGARYGGEEFVAICPETKIEDALVVAERIRKSISEYNFDFKEFQPLGFVSVSIGVANFPDFKVSDQELKSMADQGLYLAKKSGRNQIKIIPK